MDATKDNQDPANDETSEFAVASIAEIRLAAEQGNFRASRKLGTMYFDGEGVEKDEAMATTWWQLADQQQHDAKIIAAEAGDVEAQFDLGIEYIWGSWAVDKNSYEHNEEGARKWFRMAAVQGHAQAQYELGSLYSEHQWCSLPPDPEECFKWTRLAANQGETEALSKLGRMFTLGTDGAPQNFVEAARHFRLAAEQGDIGSMDQLGRMYAHGRPGLPQNDDEAANWYSLEADSGLHSPFFSTGPEEPLKRYQLLAARGYSESQYELGVRYEEGLGVERDFAEAAKWYRLSAEQGNALAQFKLGLMHAEGKGMPQDDDRAVGLYLLAANQGMPAAQNYLGVMYTAGRGVKQDCRKGAAWVRRSAKQGNETARFNLGLMYQEGSGVAKNEDKAAKWYRLAAKQGYRKVKERVFKAQQARDAVYFSEIVNNLVLAKEALPGVNFLVLLYQMFWHGLSPARLKNTALGACFRMVLGNSCLFLPNS